jgi:hypothetical protein
MYHNIGDTKRESAMYKIPAAHSRFAILTKRLLIQRKQKGDP